MKDQLLQALWFGVLKIKKKRREVKDNGGVLQCNCQWRESDGRKIKARFSDRGVSKVKR